MSINLVAEQKAHQAMVHKALVHNADSAKRNKAEMFRACIANGKRILEHASEANTKEDFWALKEVAASVWFLIDEGWLTR